MDPLLYIPLTKVDEERREVYGIAATEDLDHDNEIFDYESSKPEIQKWSDAAFKASGGKSLGNVRSMHGHTSAGKLTKLEFDDAGKRVLVCAKIVDDNEWEKVKEGVLTGFSFGGKYLKKWADSIKVMAKRYTAGPSELSLADAPCIPTALFEFVKASGISEQRPFKKVAERKDVSPKSGTSTYGNVAFADEKNKKYPLDTAAHVRNAASRFGDQKNRGKYSAEDQKTIQGHIDAAKKKFGIGEEAEKMVGLVAQAISGVNALRKNEKLAKLSKSKVLAKVAEIYGTLTGLLLQVNSTEPDKLKKGLYGVSSLANAISTIDWITRDAECEAEMEGDDSEIPEQLKEVRGTLGLILVQMAQEEVLELDPQTTITEGADAVELTDVEKLAKAAELLASVKDMIKLAKAAKSSSAKDSVQAIHDASVNLGATHNDMHDGEAGYEKGGDGGEGKDGEGKDGEEAEKIAKAVTAATAPLIERLAKLESAPANGSGPQASSAEALAKQIAERQPDLGGEFRPAGVGAGSVQDLNKAQGFLDELHKAQKDAQPVTKDLLMKNAERRGNLALLK